MTHEKPVEKSHNTSVGPLEKAISLVRFVFYRPVPSIRWRETEMSFPGPGAMFTILAALVFVTLSSFVPQPLFYANVAFGSPSLSIRAGMLAIVVMLWIIAMSMKANLIRLVTGIGHERLNVLYR